MMSEGEKSWKDQDSVVLRSVEMNTRDDVDSVEEFAITLENDEVHEDDRDYVDRIFKDYSTTSGVYNKKVRGIKCGGGPGPDKVPEGTLAVLFDYKVKRTQGKRDPLAGNHVLLMSTPKGPVMVPLQSARKFALHILRVMDGIEDEFAAKNMSLALSEDASD